MRRVPFAAAAGGTHLAGTPLLHIIISFFVVTLSEQQQGRGGGTRQIKRLLPCIKKHNYRRRSRARKRLLDGERSQPPSPFDRFSAMETPTGLKGYSKYHDPTIMPKKRT
jgi:hypothetical protein